MIDPNNPVVKLCAEGMQAEAEELRWLNFDELKMLAEASDKLISDAIALVKSRRTPMLVGASLSPAAAVDVATGEPAEQSSAPTVSDHRDAAAADIATPDTP